MRKVTSSAAGRQPFQTPLQPDSNPTDRPRVLAPQPLLSQGSRSQGPGIWTPGPSLPRPRASGCLTKIKAEGESVGSLSGGPSPRSSPDSSVFPRDSSSSSMVTWWWRRGRVWSRGWWAGHGGARWQKERMDMKTSGASNTVSPSASLLSSTTSQARASTRPSADTRGTGATLFPCLNLLPPLPKGGLPGLFPHTPPQFPHLPPQPNFKTSREPAFTGAKTLFC